MTRTRIARMLILGATLGAAARLYEDPHDPGRFWHLIACTLASVYAVSRHHRGDHTPVNDHEAAAVYLSPPVSLLANRYDTTAPNALWVVAATLWAITIWFRRENESS